MARKFLSFLGTGDYVPANYYFKDQKICAVDYVQEDFQANNIRNGFVAARRKNRFFFPGEPSRQGKG